MAFNASKVYQDGSNTAAQWLTTDTPLTSPWLEEWSTGSYRHHIITDFDIVYLVLLSITTVVGNFGNVMVIGAVLTHRPLRKEGNIFIVNLAIADLCVTGEFGSLGFIFVYFIFLYFINVFK